ncbi:MAG: hypothetical protein ACI4PM_07310 [Butyricicoccus sp.]
MILSNKSICSCALLLALLLTGCSGSSESDASASTDTGSAAVQTASEQGSSDSASDTSISENAIDVDLTTLSSTMVYSEVSNMMTAPDDYVGKTVKMNGQFTIFTNQDESQYYYAVVIADATACCQQGLEFVLKGGSDDPNDYPEIDDEITVVGTFETYDEDGVTYCHLVDANVVASDA